MRWHSYVAFPEALRMSTVYVLDALTESLPVPEMSSAQLYFRTILENGLGSGLITTQEYLEIQMDLIGYTRDL